MQNQYREQMATDSDAQGFEGNLKRELGLSIDQIPDLDPDYDANFCASEEGLLVGGNDAWAVFRNIVNSGLWGPREDWYGNPEAFFKVRLAALTYETLRKAEDYAQRVAKGTED